MASPDRSIPSRELRRRAHRAYVVGRMRWTLGRLLPLVPIVLVAALIGKATLTLTLALALVIVSAALIFAGRGLDRAVRSGWLAGTVPMLVALTTVSRFGCDPAGCGRSWMWLCVGAGVLVGVWLGGTLPGRQRVSTGLASLTVAALTAAAGCVPLGLGTAVGALAGLTLGLAPTWAYRRATET